MIHLVKDLGERFNLHLSISLTNLKLQGLLLVWFQASIYSIGEALFGE